MVELLALFDSLGQRHIVEEKFGLKTFQEHVGQKCCSEECFYRVKISQELFEQRDLLIGVRERVVLKKHLDQKY